MSHGLCRQLDPRPVLHPAPEIVQGVYGRQHDPMGKCTVQIRMSELSAVKTYNVIVDNMEEDLLLDATMMHKAGKQLNYDTQELIHKDKVVKGEARISRIEYRAR